MINVFMEQAVHKEQIHVIGRSVAKRQFIYVKDVAGILYDSAVLDHGSVIINAGMDQAYSNLEIAELVNTVFHNEVPTDYDDSSDEKIEASAMCTDKCRYLLGYECLSMEKALGDIAASWKVT